MKREIVTHTPAPVSIFFFKHPAWIHRPRTVFLLAGNFLCKMLQLCNFLTSLYKKKSFLTLKTYLITVISSSSS